MSKRIPDTAKSSQARSIKSAHKKSATKMSLKLFASTTPSLKDANEAWRANKVANFANPPQGIGNTHKVKTRQSKPAATTTAAK
jgi:hypothetical protein